MANSVLKKPHVISFASWKIAQRKLDLSKAFVSMDGEKRKVTVQFLEK